MSLTRNEMLAVIARGEVVTYRDSVLRVAGDVPSDVQIAADAETDAASASLIYDSETGYRFSPAASHAINVKASSTEVDTGTDDTKYVTPKAIADSSLGGGGGTPNITIPMLLSSTTVDLNEGTTAKQPLYTCPASRRCIVTNIILQKITGASVAALQFQIGWNAGANGVGVYDSGGLPLSPLSNHALLMGTPSAADGLNFLRPNPPTGLAGEVLGLAVLTPEGVSLTGIVNVFGYWTDTNGVPIANVVGVAS